MRIIVSRGGNRRVALRLLMLVGVLGTATWLFAQDPGTPIQPAGEVVFESSAMAIKAVLDGVGVAVAQLPYVSDELASGRLVAPFPIVRQRFESWYLAYRPIRQNDPALLLFRDWLHGEAKAQRQQYERLS